MLVPEAMEFPRIDNRFIGKEYKFFYALGSDYLHPNKVRYINCMIQWEKHHFRRQNRLIMNMITFKMKSFYVWSMKQNWIVNTLQNIKKDSSSSFLMKYHLDYKNKNYMIWVKWIKHFGLKLNYSMVLTSCGIL